MALVRQWMCPASHLGMSSVAQEYWPTQISAKTTCLGVVSIRTVVRPGAREKWTSGLVIRPGAP